MIAIVIGRTRWSAPAPGDAKHDDDRLGPVRNRGQRVERQRRQTFEGGYLLLGETPERERRPDQGPPGAAPYPCGTAVGGHVGTLGAHRAKGYRVAT